MKKWYKSRTIWGALVAVAAIGLRRVGVELGAEEQAQIVGTVCDIVGCVGGAIAIQGRTRATESLH